MNIQDINELAEEAAVQIVFELGDMTLEQSIEVALSYMDIDDYDQLVYLFGERFEKSETELKTIISKVLADTLIQLQKDCIWTSVT